MGNELKQKLPDYARLVTEKAFEEENAQRRKNIVTELEQAIRTSKSYGRPEDMTPRVSKTVETPVLDDARTTQQKAADVQETFDSYMGSQEQEQKQKQQKAEANYSKAQQQAEEDRAVMENDLAAFEKWDKEDQLKLHKVIDNGMGSFNALLGAVSGDAMANAYFAQKELEDKYGADVVSRMVKSVSRSQNQQSAKKAQEEAAQIAQEYPFLGSLARVPMNLIGAVAGPLGTLSEVIRGGKGQYHTLDPNNIGGLTDLYAGGILQGVASRIEGEDGNWLRKLASIGYVGVMSATDSAARLAAGGFIPGVSAVLAASQTFSSALRQYSAQGAAPEQAAAAALASAAIEYITEKIPMDELLKVGKGGNVWKDILKQTFLVEPTTEEIGLFANVAAEAAILGEKSDRSQRIGELIAGGATYKEAKAQVNKELWNDAARTYAVSAVSGFAGAGGAAMGNRGTDVQMQTEQQEKQAQPVQGSDTDAQAKENAQRMEADQKDRDTMPEALDAVELENYDLPNPEAAQQQRLDQEIDALGAELAANAPAQEQEDQSERDRAFQDAIDYLIALESNAPAQAQAPQTEANRALQNAIDEALGVAPSREETTSVNTDPTEHTAREQAVIDAYQESVDNDLVNYVQLVKENPGRRLPRYPLDPVNDRAATDIQRLTGIDVHGNKTEIEARSVEHILKRHGENGAANHSMRDVNDIGRIQYVIDNYDSMEHGGTTSAYRYQDENGKQVHAQTVLIKKKVNGTYFVVEAVPDTKKKTLYVLSAYMSKNGQKETAPSLVGDAEAYRFTSETKAKSDTVLTDSITEHGAEVKGTGAAERGFSQKYALIDRYGNIPEGENPVRADQLPASITGDDRVSYTARTALEAEATPDEFAELIENETMRGGFSYIPISNDETVQAATERIRAEGWRTARANWTADVRAGKASPDLTATGALLYNHAVNSGDYQEAMDILMDYQLSVRNSAQALQAARILKTLTPADRLYMIRRSVDRMVQDMKLDQKIEINEDLARQYQEAGTQEEADEILDEITADVARQIKPKGMEVFNALRYLNMLGNLRTQARNVFGNLGSRMTYAVKNQIAATMEDVVAAVNPNYQRSKVHFVNRETKRAALEDYENVKDWLLGGGKYNDRSESGNFAQMVQDKRKILPPVLEQYRRATNWAMKTGDQVFSKSAYANALAGYLNARGIRTDDLSTVNERLLNNARAYAVQQAQEQTFRDNNQVSNFVGGLLRGRNTPTWAKVIGEGIMPFRKTPANVLVRAEEFSPLGLINSAVNTYRAARGQITGAELVESWAKSLTGVGLFALGSALHDMGFLTGGPDPDEEKEAFETMNGYQNYALMLPDGTNITIDFLSPMAIPLFLGAQFDQVRTAETDMGWDDYEKLLTSLGDPLIQMSMLQGVNDTLDNLRYADNTMGQFLLNAMASYLTQGLTNTLAGQIERSTEENRMTTYIDKDSNMPQWLQRQLGKASQKIPGLDYQQTEYRDALGAVQENYGGSTGGRLLYNLLSPGYLSKAEETALTEELNRLRDATGENVYPQAPEKSFNYTDTDGNRHNGYNLSAEEMDTMQKVQGETAADLLNAVIRSEDYKVLTDAQKASVIQNVYSYAQEQGKKAALPDYHSTAAAWMGKLGNNKAAGIIRRGALSEIDRAIDDAVNSFENGWKVTGAAKSDIEEVAKAFDKMSADAKGKAMEDASGNTFRFLEMRMEGLSTDDYLDIAKAIAGLKPEEGKKTVSDSQKWEAISKSSKLTDAEKDAAIKAYMTDYDPESSSPNTTELKYDYARQELGISPEEYIKIISAEGKKAERIQKWQDMGYTKEEAAALWNLFGSTSKNEKTDVVSWYNSKGK